MYLVNINDLMQILFGLHRYGAQHNDNSLIIPLLAYLAILLKWTSMGRGAELDLTFSALP